MKASKPVPTTLPVGKPHEVLASPLPVPPIPVEVVQGLSAQRRAMHCAWFVSSCSRLHRALPVSVVILLSAVGPPVQMAIMAGLQVIVLAPNTALGTIRSAVKVAATSCKNAC